MNGIGCRSCAEAAQEEYETQIVYLGMLHIACNPRQAATDAGYVHV